MSVYDLERVEKNILLYVGHQCIEAADWNLNWYGNQ